MRRKTQSLRCACAHKDVHSAIEMRELGERGGRTVNAAGHFTESALRRLALLHVLERAHEPLARRCAVQGRGGEAVNRRSADRQR